jgi:hypothetical protein
MTVLNQKKKMEAKKNGPAGLPAGPFFIKFDTQN